MLRTEPNFSNSTNRVPAHSSRHQTSASFARFLLKRQHNSPLSSSSLLVVGKPWRVDYRVQLSSAAQGWKCMIITLWKCNQSSYVSCLPVYNSYYRELTGKKNELSISNCTQLLTHQGFPTTSKLLQESGELCSLFNRNPAKLADVWCLELCAGTLRRHRLQCIVIMRSFLRLLKLYKLAVYKLDLRGGVSLCVTVCYTMD